MRFGPQKATRPWTEMVRNRPICGVKDLGMYGNLLGGNRETSISAQCCRARGRLGKAHAGADDERNGGVRPVHSTNEASEQNGGTRCGAGGGKGRGQEECGSAKHEPDAEPGDRVTSAGAHTRSRNQKQAGETDRASAPYHRGQSPPCLLQPNEERGAGH